MKKLLIMLSVLVLASGLWATGNKETKQITSATFGGSSTVAPVALAAIEAFQEKNADVKLSYETLGSSVGIKALMDKTLTLAGSSRELKSSELEAGLIPTTIGLDAISVAVNASVGISNLSMNELAAIFSGEIKNWKEVGGPDRPIILIVRDESSGTYGSFKEIVLDAHKKSGSKDAIVARENGELAAKIASTADSIGYIGMAFNHLVTEQGGTILSIDKILPSEKTVRDNSYPISRSLYLVSDGTLKEGTVEKRFVDFVLSKEGQALVSESGYVRL